jgi:hypothetical protein
MYSRPVLKTGVPEGQVRAAHVDEEVPDAHPGQLQEHLQLGPHCAGGLRHWALPWSVQTEKKILHGIQTKEPFHKRGRSMNNPKDIMDREKKIIAKKNLGYSPFNNLNESDPWHKIQHT